MRRGGPAAGLLLAALLLGAPAVLEGQVVQGRVLDTGTGRGIPDARVSLLGEGEETLEAVPSDADGAFEIEAPGPGSYRLRVERLGYPAHTGDPIELQAGERTAVEIHLDPEAIRLDSLVVVGRGRELGRDQFERRREESDGVFLDPIHVALREAAEPSQLFRSLEEVRVDHQRLVHVPGGRCLVVFLDHSPLPVMVTGRLPVGARITQMLGGELHLDDLVAARDVRGIELYPTLGDVPDEIRDGFRGSVAWTCSIAVVWTTVGW